eukprot:232265-Chlamydomonas_euryale.AAC.4
MAAAGVGSTRPPQPGRPSVHLAPAAPTPTAQPRLCAGAAPPQRRCAASSELAPVALERGQATAGPAYRGCAACRCGAGGYAESAICRCEASGYAERTMCGWELRSMYSPAGLYMCVCVCAVCVGGQVPHTRAHTPGELCHPRQMVRSSHCVVPRYRGMGACRRSPGTTACCARTVTTGGHADGHDSMRHSSKTHTSPECHARTP